MEATDARKSFPCFDEPSFKAQFQMKMIRHKNFTSSLFNSPLIKTEQHPEYNLIIRKDTSENFLFFIH